MMTGFKVVVWHGVKLVAVHSLLPPGHVRIQALNGWRYQLVDAETGVAPKNVLMRRKGKSLIIDFMDGAGQEDTVELAGFFDVDLIDAGVVATAPDGSFVAYEAHPSHGIADPLQLSDGQSTLWSVGDRVVAQAAKVSSTAGAIGWAPVVLTAVALGAAAGGGGSGGAVGSPATAPAQLVVQGVVAAGPVVDGHGLIVRVFGVDGTELGSASVAADGTYAVTIDPNYTGAVLVKVYDIDDGADYLDEGTRSTKDLATDLRAMLWVDKPGTYYVVNVNPLTELAVQKLGLGAGDRGASASTPGATWNAAVAAQAIRDAKNAVAQAFGLAGVDLVTGPVALVVDRDGRDNAQANEYGRALAAIAGMEVTKGVATQTVTSMIAQAMQTDDAWTAIKSELVAGARAAQVDADLFARQIGAVRTDAAAVLQEAWNTVYAMSRDGGAVSKSLSNERLAALGVSASLSPAQSALLSSAINQLPRAAVDSVAELDGLVRAVHAVSSASSGGALRVQDVRLLGVKVSNPDHLGLVQVLLRERFPSGQFALSDLKNLIDTAANVGQLGANLGNLSPAAAAAITPTQLATISNVGQLGAKQINALTPVQVAALVQQPTHLPTLSTVTVVQSTVAGSAGDSKGESITLTITFDRLVNGLASGNNSTVFSLGGVAVAATWGGVDGSNTRTLTYTVQAGQNGQAAIDEAALKAALIAGISDAAGNGFVYTANSGNIANIDATPLPVVDTTAPTATLTTGSAANTGSATVQSSEVGTAYLVKTGGTNAVTVTDLASITDAADARWNQVAIATANTNTSLSLAGLEDGSYTLYTVDQAGNLSAASSSTFTAITPLLGSATISMGTWGGQLIAPVQVEGKWYYVWDRNGDGLHNSSFFNGKYDYTTMDSLEMMFFGNSVGTVMTSNNRTMALDNGRTIMLPTRGDGVLTTGISQNGTAVNSPTQTNSTYDDLLAIWDAHNGGSTGTGMAGAPAGWRDSNYWSATPSASGHAVVSLYDGHVRDNPDFYIYVAFQVL